MTVLLALLAAIVAANAVLLVALVLRFRSELRMTRDDELHHIVGLWQAHVGRDVAGTSTSAS